MQAFTNSYNRKDAKDAQDWEIVPTDCSWRMPYKAGLWTFSGHEDPAGGGKSPSRQFRGSMFQRSFPLRPTALKGRLSSKDARCDSDTSLNLELAGIQGALVSLVSYERAVGFQYEAFPNIEPRELDTFAPLDLSNRGLDEDVTQIHKEQWNELLEDLMRTPLAETPETDDSSDMDGADILHYSTSTLSSMDLSSSEGSIESLGMPATPKAKSHHRVEIKSGSPTGSIIGGSDYHTLSPGRLLNASASSFIPGFSSHFTINEEPLQFPSLQDAPTLSTNPKSPSFTNFSFPTLNPSSSLTASVQAAKSKKDSQGLFMEDNGSTTPALLPPFLQEPAQRSSRTRKSRTREIVDRLRSEASPNEESSSASTNLRATVSPNYASYSPSPLPTLEDSDSVIQLRRAVSEDGNVDHQHRPSASTTSFSASVSVSASTSASTSGLSTPDAVEEDDDGWINVARPVSASSAAILAASTSLIHQKEDKSKRTRELFLALTKRRTDSLSSEQWREIVHNAGAKVDSEDVSSLEASISSLPSPPKTPPSKHPELSGWNQGSPPNPGPYMNGWVEHSPIGSPEASLPHTPKSQKEKTPRKDSHHRKKSSAHNFNQVNHTHSHSTTWTRGPSAGPHLPLAHLQHHPHPHVHLQQHPHAHLHVHQHHQHQHVPMGQFPPTSSPVYPTQPMMSHTPSASTTVAPGPYFFPAYQTVGVGMPVGIAVPIGSSLAASPIAYQSAQYGVMQPAHGYPMVAPPVTGVYASSPSTLPGGYSHMRVNQSKPSTLTSINANVTSMPMPVPVGAGYAGMGATRGKGTW
ncbi:hypothetical protein CPB83DRAFT_852209 [Crepidotus variabilis]|uniref:Uncharacterized protein n=1 Tax=Crepidotus variabilis TaxID=179855 RepID=A0A9P6EIX6_9AGAR|nr:hypothetical protein CPB83DRAFT_852209 [Crepidotus variabilis]